MPEVSFDLKSKHPLLPHPEVTRLHQENNFPYYKTVQDYAYERWYAETKKVGKISTGKITILINQMYRTKQMDKDYIFYDAFLYGTDRTGNKLDFYIRIGRYEKPIFRKQVDQRTDKIISHEIFDKEMTYEIEYTPELFDSLLEQAREKDLSLAVIGTGRSYTIPNAQDFRDGTYEELIEIGKTGESLATIRKEKEKEKEQEKAAKATPTPTPF